jgi:hypothetical protein
MAQLRPETLAEGAESIQEVNNGVMAEALRVSGVVATGGEAAPRRVEPVEAAAVGADL